MQGPEPIFDLEVLPLVSHSPPAPPATLVIKVPPRLDNMAVTTRRRTISEPSGSEYNASEPYEEPESPAPQPVFATTSRGRRIVKKTYKESASEDDYDLRNPASALFDNDASVQVQNSRSNGVAHDGDDEDEDDVQPRYNTRRRSTRNLPDFVIEDEDSKQNGYSGYPTRSKSRNPPKPKRRETRGSNRPPPREGPSDRALRAERRKQKEEADVYVDVSSNNSADADGSLDEAPHTSSEPEADIDMDQDHEAEQENDGRPYALRQRVKINYAIPPPLEEVARTAKPKPRANNRKKLGWSMSGADLGKLLGDKGGNDSDSDYGRSPRKPFTGAAGAASAFTGGGMLPSDFAAAAAGTPSNLGKIGDAALADADPLGVNVNVTFDEVGGLDDHIHALKEMTLLPLLYPEVFKQFNVTPPRGVLFHGPPGTGKTLLARALAASCRTDDKQISFFMRKGADCLSKWVGEAERQLRLLFEEARNCQPSIIFFDEIDGLAPVRSSKQDQIHASIVSTLLALMDGMDGRGQVVVIGATNRPDAVDPALRRPGRFDREFYFPLPKLEAREKIIGIMTKGWNGWESDKGAANVLGLAKLTKGYGGADLRALCTEAALNAIQRRYPQIYKTKDRLLLSPESIEVGMRDFMISIRKLVPSSARSSSSTATPLPLQFEPLLSNVLERAKSCVDKVLPRDKRLTALEEAEYEDDGSLEKEMMMQSMETLRIYRPRVILHGQVGMGQAYIGAALLHHLEGYHIQSLELGTLMGDSTRTVEAAIVQLFVEAKRHQPSVIYIPSLLGWCAAISEVSRSTVRAMLDTLAPTDPVLVLAVLDGEFSSLPRDIRDWFGHGKENRIAVSNPTSAERESFFQPLLADLRRPPNEFPDGVKRRKRILEVLPIAPPLEPRKPTPAELALQEENDRKTVVLLQYRLMPILTELKRKFKRFSKRATEEYNFDPDEILFPPIEQPVSLSQNNEPVAPAEDNHKPAVVIVNGASEHPAPTPGFAHEPLPQPSSPIIVEPWLPMPTLYDMDLDKMSIELYQGNYLTPGDFFDDIQKIVHNARVRIYEDNERFHRAEAMRVAAEVSINEFDPVLKLECERMADREKERREQRRRRRDKDKEPPKEPIVRRSTRQNGPLDITITDPTALERRLKRQRSDDAGGESGGSEGEQAAKRSRMSTEGDEHPQPLSVLPTSPSRPSVVRFAPEEDDDFNTMSPLGSHRKLISVTRTPFPPPVFVDGQTSQSDQMTIDVIEHDESRRSGFDPFLLNPLPEQPSSSLATLPTSQPAIPSFIPEALTLSQLPINHSKSPCWSPVSAHIPKQNRTPPPDMQPMQVERSPSPPLPDFHADEVLLTHMKGMLRDKTLRLNVEQLEQLRATCFSTLWRRRTDWNRDDLIKSLLVVVDEFIEEVEQDNSEDDSLPVDSRE